MLSHKPIFAALLSAALLSMVIVAGCSSISRIDEAIHDEMSQITVVTENGRTEQLFQQEFERLIARNSLKEARYQLKTKISSNRGENNMVMMVDYHLYDSRTGEVLTSHRFSSSASIGGVTSIFGEDQATIHAGERLSVKLAEKVYNHLVLFFTRNRSGT
jgi:hypothetical protein